MTENFNREEFKKKLEAGCSALELQLSSSMIDNLLVLLDQLLKWNKAYNLTAIKNIDEILSHHLLDSFSLIPYINGDNIIDVGTGPGFPGLPLSIYYTDKRFTLLDSNGKKMQFIQHVKGQLELMHVTGVQHRVETFSTANLFDICLTRAFSSLADIVVKCKHLIKPGGKIIAMKGKFPNEELEEITEMSCIAETSVKTVFVPGLDADRHVVEIILK